MLSVTRLYLLIFPEPLLRTNCWHCLHVFLAGFGEAKPRARTFIELRCVSLQVVTNCSLAKIFTVNSPRRRTLLGSVCLTEIHSESLWFLRLLFWTTPHLQFTHPWGIVLAIRTESSFASETFCCSVSKREVWSLPDTRLDQFMRCYILSFVDEIFGWHYNTLRYENSVDQYLFVAVSDLQQFTFSTTSTLFCTCVASWIKNWKVLIWNEACQSILVCLSILISLMLVL